MCVSCRENMRETDIGQTTDRPSLLYGKLLSHRAGTGPLYIVKFGGTNHIVSQIIGSSLCM